jgi:hypothetical protein
MRPQIFCGHSTTLADSAVHREIRPDPKARDGKKKGRRYRHSQWHRVL